MSKEKQILQYWGDGRSQRQTAASLHRFVGDCRRHTGRNYSSGGSLDG